MTRSLKFEHFSTLYFFIFLGFFFPLYSFTLFQELRGNFFFDVILELFERNEIALLKLRHFVRYIPETGVRIENLFEFIERVFVIPGALPRKAEIIAHLSTVLSVD